MTDTKKIVTIGGGSGQFALLSGLRHLPGIDITAIVAMVDSGGSTGRLRDELGTLPPGDVLKCILALSPYDEMARRILLKRFTRDRRLLGHNAGNMLLTMLSRYTGSFPAGIDALAEILDARGTILPVTIDRATLVAELTDGSRIFGEKAIDIPSDNQRESIRNVYLVPHHSDRVSVFPPVLEAIRDGDFIIVGPGDLFTSILPNLIVPGVKKALRVTRAKILFVVNIMTKFGETHHFTAQDFAARMEDAIGRRLDGFIYNTRKPGDDILQRYSQQNARFVEIDKRLDFWKERRVYAGDLLETGGGIVRHDSDKLATLLERVVR
ncbi:MAG: uridine diphosphate-N-acetylglucosamine-binding protein YvcK [Deltaproteobacteria bacterium]|nr:uridine diphosphate-N-acetylglucosamine-binding protein YvcK [Deltaproteobacteria bacterium]